MSFTNAPPFTFSHDMSPLSDFKMAVMSCDAMIL
jgi:hypothetical protein